MHSLDVFWMVVSSTSSHALNRKIVAQDRKCAICQEQFDDYKIVPDHRCRLALIAGSFPSLTV